VDDVDVDVEIQIREYELYLNVAKLGEEDGHDEGLDLVMTGRVK
jgi:hypothetical protein